MTRQLAIKQPFNLELSLMMGQAFRWRKLPKDFYGDGHKWFSGVLGDNLVHIRQVGGLNGPVEYRIGGPDGERAAGDAEDVMLRRYFRDDTDDVTAIYDSISRDPVVAGLVQEYPGMRVLRQEPLECLVTYICTTGTPIRRVRNIVETMAKTWGREVELSGESRHIFPETLTLMRAGTWLRQEMQPKLRFTERQSNAIVEVARMVSSGELDWLFLESQCYDATIQRLKAIKGVGYKIADCVAMMSLERLQAYPLDTWVRKAMEEWYRTDFPMPSNPNDPSERDHGVMIAWTHRKFGPYAGYAGQYLFHGINPQKETETNKHENRSRPCPKCGAEVGSSCRYPSGYYYPKGHSER